MSTGEQKALELPPDMPEDETHAECRSKLDLLLELVAGHDAALKKLTDQVADQAAALHSMAGDFKAIRGFMQSHNTALGELRQRFDRLECMAEPCEGNGRQKTPSSEVPSIG
jgi:hypothetical protein